MSDCLFCKIIAKEIPASIVYETDDILAFLDLHPVNKGHVLVVPKQHSEGSHDASPAVLGTLLAAIQKIAQGIGKVTGAPAYNVLQNNGAAAGQVIPHLHFHIIPRFEGDGFTHWHGKQGYAEGEMAQLAQNIAQCL